MYIYYIYTYIFVVQLLLIKECSVTKHIDRKSKTTT